MTVCQVGDGYGYVRTIVPSTLGGADGLLYIATTKNDILHGSLQDKLTTIIHVRIIAYIVLADVEIYMYLLMNE